MAEPSAGCPDQVRARRFWGDLRRLPGLDALQVVETALGGGFAVGVLVGAGVVDAGLLEPFLDNAVIDHHRITPAAIAEAEMVLVDQHAHAAREMARAF